MSVNLNADWIVDIRMPIPGNSFVWHWTDERGVARNNLEPLANKKSIVVHGTGVSGRGAPLQDGFQMADYHMRGNNWQGIGVHFVITSDNYPGRPGKTSPGAQIQYVGDLSTFRWGCLNQNNGRVHIEIVKDNAGDIPSRRQLELTRRLIDFLLYHTPQLPSLKYWNQVTYHNAVPGQNTLCPGWKHSQFGEWMSYLQKGDHPFPAHLYPAPAPAPTMPIPSSAVHVPPPAPIIPPPDTRPEWERTWREERKPWTVVRPGAVAIDVANSVKKGQLIKVSDIPVGHTFEGGGTFENEGTTYVRSAWSAGMVVPGINRWNGVPISFFEPTGQVEARVPVNTPDHTVPKHSTDPGQDLDILGAFKELPAEIRDSFSRRIAEAFALILGPLIRVIASKGLLK